MKDDDKFNQEQSLEHQEDSAQEPAVEITPQPFSETKINADKAINLDKETVADNTSFSSVAQSANSKKIAIIAISVFLLIVIYYLYNNVQETTKPKQTPTEKIQQRSQTKAEIVKESKPVIEQQQTQVAEAPKLEAPPPLQAPKAPTPPPAPAPEAPQAPVFPTISGTPSTTGAPTPPVFQPSGAPTLESPFKVKEEEEKEKKTLEERRKASIMVMGGTSRQEAQDIGKNGSDTAKDKDKDKDKTTDKDKGSDKDKTKDKSGYLGFGEGQFGESTIPKTNFDQVKVTKIGRLDSVIAQGKIINAVLENAINTDLPGTLRAIVTRDVYAEGGKNILIPKGSRVIGTYQSEVKAGQTRVAVVWNRLIRPDGLDLALDSNGTDTLGRTGIKGFLDNKFLTRLGNAMLISYVVPIMANRIFNVDKNASTTSTAVQNATTGTTSTTTTSSIGAQQAKQSSDKLQEIMQKTIEDTFSTKPTIYVDQGSEINILVNKDLVFPEGALSNSMQVVK